MKLGQDREETYYSFPLDLTDDEAKQLKKIALKYIINDDNALINYAVNFILAEQVKDIEKVNETLKNKIKEKKSNASKSKS